MCEAVRGANAVPNAISLGATTSIKGTMEQPSKELQDAWDKALELDKLNMRLREANEQMYRDHQALKLQVRHQLQVLMKLVG